MAEKSSLGDRMKAYEKQYSGQKLLPLIPLCARMDGRSFHTWTKGLHRPYDERLSKLMVETTKFLVAETNARIGYTQSDEISLVWFTEEIESQVFFDANLLKMTSLLASLTTGFFIKNMLQYLPEKFSTFPMFDARVWNVPVDFEASNYLLWREMDATRNSITMAAQTYYSHNELHKKNSSEKQELLFQKGINWNDYPAFFKRGSYVGRRTIKRPLLAEEIAKLPPKHAIHSNPNLEIVRTEIQVLEFPPLSKIKNRTDVVLRGEQPILKEDSDLAQV